MKGLLLKLRIFTKQSANLIDIEMKKKQGTS